MNFYFYTIQGCKVHCKDMENIYEYINTLFKEMQVTPVQEDNVEQEDNVDGKMDSTPLTLVPEANLYIQVLVSPYINAMEPVTDLDALRQWIPGIFKDKADELSNALEANVSPLLLQLGDTATTDDGVVKIARTTITDFILRWILSKVITHFTGSGENIVLPWDVLDLVIASSDGLADFLQMDKNSKTLPVTVVIGSNKFEHNMTKELAYGLSLFCVLTQIDCTIYMYETPLYQDLWTNPNNRFSDESTLHDKYKITLTSGQSFKFETSDFIQGLATGAQWAGADVSTYITDLIDKTGQSHVFELTA